MNQTALEQLITEFEALEEKCEEMYLTLDANKLPASSMTVHAMRSAYRNTIDILKKYLPLEKQTMIDFANEYSDAGIVGYADQYFNRKFKK